jgi:hypothetical protein
MVLGEAKVNVQNGGSDEYSKNWIIANKLQQNRIINRRSVGVRSDCLENLFGLTKTINLVILTR